MFLVEDSPVGHGMEEGPVCLVATAVVEAVEEAGLDAHRHDLARLEAGRWCVVFGARLWYGVDFLVEVVETRPADPQAAAVDNDGRHRRHQATGAVG